MLQAQLRGKLTRKEEDLEDLLTSNVFGSIKYVPSEDALLPLLATSIDIDGNAPFVALQPVSSTEYHFWPWVQEQGCEGCEPDVLARIRCLTGKNIIVFIEAKYLSDKSSEATEGDLPTDQLAREWDNLTCLADRENAMPLLLYVTADMGFPRKSVEESRQEYMRKRKKDMSVFWISWRKLPKLFSYARHQILNDLVEVLRRQGLIFFEGILKPELFNVEWSFKAEVHWNWSLFKGCCIMWSFGLHKSYNWSYVIGTIKWRFDR
jgi:hypothetical protein